MSSSAENTALVGRFSLLQSFGMPPTVQHG